MGFLHRRRTKDGKVKIRACQNFWKLNAITKKDYFLLPFTDIILYHVSGHICYSFLDIIFGYNQVLIRKGDQLETTFTTEWGTLTRCPSDCAMLSVRFKDS